LARHHKTTHRSIAITDRSSHAFACQLLMLTYNKLTMPRAVRRRRRTVSQPKRLSSWLNTRMGQAFAAGIARWMCA
jgi:hypothetical protein